MHTRWSFLLVALFIASQAGINAQESDSIHLLTGIVFDDRFQPLPASHVINLNSHQGDVTDSLGIFSLPVRGSDTLLFRNIAFQDTLVPVNEVMKVKQVRLRRKYYPLQEARIFEWGSSYNDFKHAIVHMPNQQSLGESLDLPRQDPDYIPYEMNEEVIKSPLFLISSPVSFFYQNFSREAKSARKVYWLNKNRAKHQQFNEILHPENIASITGHRGEVLKNFILFLNENMVCDFNCPELEIHTEIHELWSIYRKLRPEEIKQKGDPPE
jgi:hypothetical protein